MTPARPRLISPAGGGTGTPVRQDPPPANRPGRGRGRKQTPRADMCSYSVIKQRGKRGRITRRTTMKKDCDRINCVFSRKYIRLRDRLPPRQ